MNNTFIFLFVRSGGNEMNIVAYAGFAYLLTAVISYAVIGIIVLTDWGFGKWRKGKEEK